MIWSIWKLIKDLFSKKKFEFHAPDEYTRVEKIHLGEQRIRILGYRKCDCWTKHGPDNTCEKCSGFGAIP